MLQTLQNAVHEKDSEISMLRREYGVVLGEKERVVGEWNMIKMELEGIKAQAKQYSEDCDLVVMTKEKEVSEIRNSAFMLINELKESFESEKTVLSHQLERIEREKNTAQMNYASDLQNLKNVSKSAVDKLNAKISETTGEAERLRNEMSYINKQLREREREINVFKEQIQRQNGKMEDQKTLYLSSDARTLIDMNLRNEKERFVNEMQEREMCIICCSEKKNIVFLPCGHFAYCNICLNTLNIEPNKKIPKSHPHSKCSVCDNYVEKACRAFPY